MTALPRFQLPLPAAEFLRDYWQQQPLLAPGSASGLEHVSVALLQTLAADDEIEARLIQGAGDGPWQLRHGPFTAADLAELPPTDWTLLVQSVDHYRTDVSLLLDSFAFLPGWRLEDIMISHAVRGGSVGAHYDRYDVFLVQARGHRRWHLGPTCDEHSPRLPHDDLRLLADMPITASHLLGPGDVLYLPPGVAHWGMAEDDDCITWSVGFRAPRLTEVLARITDEALMLAGDTLFSDASRTPESAPGQLQDADVAALSEQALALLTPPAIRDGLAQLLSEPRQPDAVLRDEDPAPLQSLLPSGTLVRRGATRLLADTKGLWINGEHWPLDSESLPLANFLAAQRVYARNDLEAHLTVAGRSLIHEWTQQGFFLSLP
ncbi:JmjC domain-containing protein [Isoalcanivorax beigongshangi]|uniref:Cupin domain-containing protein n=1 Tax=Isoalcanivorax beigongshangi TaxID=3238810 RepID=A0ABV4AHC1_9GAMM